MLSHVKYVFGDLTYTIDIQCAKKLRYDLTDTAGVLENKVMGMFHGLHD